MTKQIEARVVLDSIAPNGARLTTFEFVNVRFTHGEFLTHRIMSRNSASSRAIPTHYIIEQVMNNPAMPVHWGKNESGMVANLELDKESKKQAEKIWLKARDEAVENALKLHELGLHKQLANRILEPWMLIAVICTSTNYGHFFNLRHHPAAQPEIRVLAEEMLNAYRASQPKFKEQDEWHLPYCSELEAKEHGIDNAIKISAGRCAKVTLWRHLMEEEPIKSIDRHDRMKEEKHWSPLEHQGTPGELKYYGNFYGWQQYRKMQEGEFVEEYDGENYK